MDKDENFVNYTSRGYLMNQRILYRYSPESEEEEAQLVVPAQELKIILQEYHDAPTAGHYGVENTYKKVAYRYYFRGIQKFISEYIKTCPESNCYKPTNQKPAGLLRTPTYAQKFESLAIDLFGTLPETPTGKKFPNSILDVKDRVEQKQDCQKENFDRRRRRKYYKPDDKVWVTIHPIIRNNRIRKFIPKRESPYLILTLRSPVTYEIDDPDNPDQALGTYNVSALKDYQEPETERNTGFVAPLRKRGCPKDLLVPSRDVNGTRGESVTRGLILRPNCRWRYL
ncbi:transposon Tf2-6 polyprotein [Trichonephila clavipes]|nr:transposon Tf2-6 polyprotein [Trichonephila clavipes]